MGSSPALSTIYMRIELQTPYSADYTAGYVNKGSEWRRMLVLVDLNGRLHCTAYARYLVSVREGRYLAADEEVDHINNDKKDDSLENLQILSKAENLRKQRILHAKTLKHGTYAKYKTGGCRCRLCIQAARDIRNQSYRRCRDRRLLESAMRDCK